MQVAKKVTVVLTTEEKLERAEELIGRYEKISQIEDDHKRYKESIKISIGNEEARIQEIKDILTLGSEVRTYICSVQKDYANACKNFIDEATGSVVAIEPFEEDDYQTELELSLEDTVIPDVPDNVLEEAVSVTEADTEPQESPLQAPYLVGEVVTVPSSANPELLCNVIAQNNDILTLESDGIAFDVHYQRVLVQKFDIDTSSDDDYTQSDYDDTQED